MDIIENLSNQILSAEQVQTWSAITTDNQPLASSYSDFWESFDMSRINPENPLAWFLNPVVPVSLVAAYLVGEFALKHIMKALKVPAFSGPLFTGFVTLHSFLLTAYSFITFVGILPLVVRSVEEKGWLTTFCDNDASLWNAGVGFWGTLFYVSKYWEFLDTIIIVFKGKNPSFLQVYHHAGVVLAMYLLVAAQETGGLFIITTLNSFIHTLMYAYFTITANVRLPKIVANIIRPSLTTFQLIQFFTGIGITLQKHVIEDKETCVSDAQFVSLVFVQVYAGLLIPLFGHFFASQYIFKKKGSSKKKSS